MNKSMCCITLLNEGVVRNQLSELSLGLLAGLSIMECVGSTNDEAVKLKNRVKLKADGKYVACVANQQTEGRGRNGRVWQSPANANIYMSIGFVMSSSEMQKIKGMSLLAGIAVASYLQVLGLSPKLKWPNDILVGEEKLAGILIDTKISAESVYVIVGIGLNIDMPAEAANSIDQPWTDLCRSLDTTSDKIDRNDIVAGLLNSVISCFVEYGQSEFNSFYNEWEKYDLLAGREVTVVTDTEEYKGKALGIDKNFALKVLVDGQEQVFYAADIKLKI